MRILPGRQGVQAKEGQAEMTPGFYWIQSMASGHIEPAEWDGKVWTLMGDGEPWTTDEVRGKALIGPLIEKPDPTSITLAELL